MRHAPQVLLLLVALAGCGSDPDPHPEPEPEAAPQAADDAPDHVDDEATEEARRAREGARRELARLCPIDEGVVLWFEVRRGGRERPTLGALFAANAGARPYLDTVGLEAPGDPSLTIFRGDEEVWIVPRGALGKELGQAPYRALTPDPQWDDLTEGKGRRIGNEVIETRGGQVRTVRTDHTRSGDIGVRHFFARDRGLVRLEVVVRQETVLRLDMIEAAPRERPAEGYDVTSPAALWESVTEAIRRLDVEALERLMTPELHARVRSSAWDRVRDLAPAAGRSTGLDPIADRIRAAVGDLLQLDVRLRGAWVVKGDEATVTAVFTIVDPDTGARRAERGQVALRRAHDETWRWADVRLPGG